MIVLIYKWRAKSGVFRLYRAVGLNHALPNLDIKNASFLSALSLCLS